LPGLGQVVQGARTGGIVEVAHQDLAGMQGAVAVGACDVGKLRRLVLAHAAQDLQVGVPNLVRHPPSAPHVPEGGLLQGAGAGHHLAQDGGLQVI